MIAYEQAIIDAGVRNDSSFLGLGGYDGFEPYRKAVEGGASPEERAEILRRCDRKGFVSRYSWAIPGEGALQAIASYAPIVEVASGSGYWAHELRARGVDIVATDSHPVGDPRRPADWYTFERAWCDVEKLDGLSAVTKYRDRTLLLVWPCLGRTWPARVLRAYRGDVVLYVGEGHGGCTADDRFHDLLFDRDFEAVREVPIPQWYGIHDRLFVCRRRSA